MVRMSEEAPGVTPSSNADAAPHGEPDVIILDGPRSGEVISIGDRLLVGRSPGCDLVLLGEHVSRTHAELTFNGETYSVRDLASHNGTYVNERLVTSAPVHDGDHIKIGDFTLRARLYPGLTRLSTDSQVVLGPTEDSARLRLRLHGGDPTALRASLEGSDADRVERSRRRLDALVGVTRTLARLREQERIYPLVVEEVLRVLPGERAVVLRLDAEGELQPKAARHVSEPGAQVEVSRTILEEVCAQRVSMLSADAMFEAQFEESQSIVAQGIRSVLSVPIEYDTELLGALYLDAPGRALFTEEDLHFVSGLAGVAAVAIANARAMEQVYASAQELNHSYLSTLAVLANAIEARDHYTIGHTWRVARFAQVVARRLSWGEDKLSEIEVGGMLHDIGKIGVPDAVLTKSGPLNDEEQQRMELHPEIGARMLRDVPSLDKVLPYVLHHHERFDGGGYPHHLAGDSIPSEARLLSVADSLDAMTSNRPYRKGLDSDIALAELERHAGSQFDPLMVAVLIDAFKAGELNPYLQAGFHSERDVICPRCSTCCTPEPAAFDKGTTTCPTCHRGLRLQVDGERTYADLA
jgi:HD-GYP domain-containing protein (c-di-GMP phosphodiesterase class II)/pSer/pThr/pTyr-binding forkhead associated (FHA) protein